METAESGRPRSSYCGACLINGRHQADPIQKIRKGFKEARMRPSPPQGKQSPGLEKPGLKHPLIVPTYNPLPVFIIENNLRVLGLSHEEYLRILESI